MHDDDVTNVERRLRAVLQPDDERVRRVIVGALSPDRQIHPLRPLDCSRQVSLCCWRSANSGARQPFASGAAHLRNWFCPRGDERRWQAMGGERLAQFDCPRRVCNRVSAMKECIMTRHTRMIAATIFMLLLVPRMLAGQSSSGSTSEPAQPQTSVVSVEQTSRNVGQPLETRVSVQFITSKTADVLQVLAKASGLTVELPQALCCPSRSR